jgi:hypothetical protein
MAFVTTTAPPDGLRVDQIFVRTWTIAARHWRTYLVLTTLFAMGPMMLAAAILRVDPQDLGGLPPNQRVVSMVIYLIGDIVLWPVLALMTLDALRGRPVSVARSLAVPRAQWPSVILLVALFDVPSLGINLAAGVVGEAYNIGLWLYGARFVIGMAQLSLFGAATAILMREGGGVMHALKRSLSLTLGHRWKIAVFFTAFFILKVFGPFFLAYCVFDWIVAATTHGPWAAQVRLGSGIASTLLWNALCCALSLSSALIYADLLRLKEGVELAGER